jgi:hypothetical protein
MKIGIVEFLYKLSYDYELKKMNYIINLINLCYKVLEIDKICLMII